MEFSTIQDFDARNTIDKLSIEKFMTITGQ